MAEKIKIHYLKSEECCQDSNTIKNLLDGYWKNDIWNINDAEINKYITNNITSPNRTINFKYIPFDIRQEVKYYYGYKLENDELAIKSIFAYTTNLKYFGLFIKKKYPKIKSLSEVSFDDISLKWRNYIEGEGLSSISSKGYDNYRMVFLKQIYHFIFDIFDERDEYDKDVWNCRKITGARINENNSSSILNFKTIPECFRNLIKRYIKFRSTTLSHNICVSDILGLRLFLNYIHDQEPDWEDLVQISRKHIESYLTWSAASSTSKIMHFLYISHLHTFLEYIQRAQYPEAPLTPTVCLLFKEDFPKQSRRDEEDIKYIPEGVITQFDDNIENIQPHKYQPVAIVLRASGWRISDVLSLKYDSCLEHTSKGWYLHGDIPKVDIINHRIPITDEVAAAIKTFSKEIEQKSNEENNPDHLLFDCFRGKRKGRCYRGHGVQEAFNRLAKEYNIIDDEGKIFFFRNHAFRHTKCVELINNGMNILHVQKWMAHSSPEMTLTYAKILDDTMRKSWEEVVKKGLFRINNEGKAIPINLNDVIDEDLIEWEYIKNNLDAVRMPLGYCLKPKKQECHTQLNPCLTCRNLCTTVDFIPQYEHEIREIKQLIETGKKLGRDMWVEKNEYLLQQYEEIFSVLKAGKTLHKAGKKGREYVGGERNACKQT